MQEQITKYENSSAPDAQILAVFKGFSERFAALEQLLHGFASSGASVAPEAVEKWVHDAVAARLDGSVERCLVPLEQALNKAVQAAVAAAWEVFNERFKGLEEKVSLLTPTPSGAAADGLRVAGL